MFPMQLCVARHLVNNGLDEEAVHLLGYYEKDTVFDSSELNYLFGKAFYHLFIQSKAEHFIERQIPLQTEKNDYFEQAIKRLKYSYEQDKTSKASTLLGILYECNIEINVCQLL